MKSLPTYERAHEVLSYNEESGVFTWKSRRFGVTVGKQAGTPHKGYLRIRVDGVLILAHRLAWLMSYKTWPNGEIDHINMNRADNRICNLRDVDRSANMINRNYPKGKSGHTGISSHKGGWQVSIRINHKSKFIGLFKEIDKAIDARKKAEATFYGRFSPRIQNGLN